ncbi:MAG: hypothetical protein ACRCS9_09430 [Hyphomicrobium sp.]
MAAAPSPSERTTGGAAAALAIADLVLLRIAAPSATRAELQRDLLPLLAPRISGSAFRRAAELAISGLVSGNLAAEAKGRLTASPAGLRVAESIISTAISSKTTWDALKCGPLLSRALGLTQPGPSLLKALERADGLAAVVLQQHFSLSTARVLSANDLRSELAVIALERAFGNRIKTGLGKGQGLPGKTARVLAGQLFKKPRDIASDGKLITALAADVLSAPSDSLDALRAALLRRLTDDTPAPAAQPGEAREPRAPGADTASSPRKRGGDTALEPANDRQPMVGAAPKAKAPDMDEFAGAVLDAARPVSEGWPGNRKAFISQVWQAIRVARREWELTEIAFKSMLAEAHRVGHVVLATADLKDKSSLKDLEESKILYKNTVWHFVRVED